jgi:hypothetical protein
MEDKRSLQRILQTIDATVILHNILLEFGEEDRDEWMDLDDFSDMDNAERAPYKADDELNRAVPTRAAKDLRRSHLLSYLKLFFFPV